MQRAPLPLDETSRLATLRRLHILDSPAEERFDRVIRLAKRGCYAENMVQTAVPLKSTYELNGTEVTVSLE